MKNVIVYPVGPTDVIKRCPGARGWSDSDPSSTGLQTSALLSSVQRDSGTDKEGGRGQKEPGRQTQQQTLTRPLPSARWAPPRRRSPGLRTDKL